jgi:hypothetical protein
MIPPAGENVGETIKERTVPSIRGKFHHGALREENTFP